MLHTQKMAREARAAENAVTQPSTNKEKGVGKPDGRKAVLSASKYKPAGRRFLTGRPKGRSNGRKAVQTAERPFLPFTN